MLALVSIHRSSMTKLQWTPLFSEFGEMNTVHRQTETYQSADNLSCTDTWLFLLNGCLVPVHPLC